MICTSVISCLSSGLAKNKNYVHVCSTFPAFLFILKVWFFKKMAGGGGGGGGDKPYTKAVRQKCFYSIFQRYNNYVTNFQKSAAILTKK